MNEVRVNNHKIQDGDFAVMLESLTELFQEPGEAFTPRRLAERMERKLHRQIPIHTASYIYISWVRYKKDRWERQQLLHYLQSRIISGKTGTIL